MPLPIPEVAESASSLSGVASGGGAGFGAFWLAKFLFKQDKEAIKDLKDVLKELSATVAELKTQVAVLGVHVQNAQAKSEKVDLLAAKVDTLAADIGVAHGRIRALAQGNRDITKIQKPPGEGNCNG